MCKSRCKSRNLTTASDYKNSTYRSASVKFDDFVGNITRNLIRNRLCHINNLFRCNCYSGSHNILECYFLSRCTGSHLNLLCLRKIHQIISGNHLRKFISCTRNHSVCHNAAVPCNTYIRCTCSDINKRYIK